MGCSSSVPYSLFKYYAPEAKVRQDCKDKVSDNFEGTGGIKAEYGSPNTCLRFYKNYRTEEEAKDNTEKKTLLCAIAPCQQTLTPSRSELKQGLTVRCIAASATRTGRENGASHRKANQDACLAISGYQRHHEQSLFGVFDGHGPNGEKMAGFVQQQLPQVLSQLLALEAGDDAEALRRGFLEIHRRLMVGPVDSDLSGTTAVACLLRGIRLTTAWAGDSRAVLARVDPGGSERTVAVPLTRDHEPCIAAEHRRIITAGGRVERMRNDHGLPVGPYRVWLQERGYPGLAMSRAIGDGLASLVGVTAEPECSAVDLCPGDRFLLLASDGVWGVLSCQAAVDLVAGCATAAQGAQKRLKGACGAGAQLVSAALQQWLIEENGSADDITAVVVFFQMS